MARGPILLVLILLAVSGTALVQPASSGPAFFQLADTVLVHAPLTDPAAVSNGAEPDIHVTRDGVAILIGDITGLYRSLNGGASWQRMPNPFIPGVFADGWAIAEDDVGRVYVSTTQGQIVGVASSIDHGATWDIQSDIVAVGSIVDRPWLAARGNGEVVLIVNSDTGEECYHSKDKGATFLDRSHIATAAPNPGSASYDSQGRVWFSNGDKWTRWPNTCLSQPAAYNHANGGPQILTQTALDSSDRPYTPMPSVNSAQMLLHSRNTNGVMKAVAVSPANLLSNTFGAIAVDNVTGEIAVGWYGSTTGGNPSSASFSGNWNVYVARVTGYWTASPTITVTQITTTPNHVGGFCMGGIGCSTGTADRDLLDYFGITFGPDHDIHVAYGHDGATTNSEVRYAHLA